MLKNRLINSKNSFFSILITYNQIQYFILVGVIAAAIIVIDVFVVIAVVIMLVDFYFLVAIFFFSGTINIQLYYIYLNVILCFNNTIVYDFN